MHASIHAGLEEAIATSALALDLVERKIGFLEQLGRIFAVVRTHRDTDACADQDLVSIDLIGSSQAFDDAGGKFGCAVRLRSVTLNDGKFITANSCDGVVFMSALLQALSDHLKKRVAGGMAKGVIDFLKAIEIKTQD